MSDLKHSLTLTMKDNIVRSTKKAKTAMDRFAQSGSKSLKMMSKTLPAVSKGLDKLGNKYTALLSGGAMYGAVRSVAALETRLTRLGVQAGKSKAEIDTLNKAVFKVAQDRQINIDPSLILDAVDKIVEKTGNLDLAEGNLKNIGAMISATGMQGNEAGALIAEMFEKFNIKTPAEMLSTLDLLTNQGKSGAFTLQAFATQGERVASAYARLGRNGKEGVAEMGAMLQMIRKGTGSPEQAATALEAYIRTLKDAKKQEALTKAGIQLNDSEGNMRSGVDIMKDIIKLVNGNDTQISKIFDAESMRVFSSVVKEFNDTKGNFKGIDDFLKVESTGQTLMADSARVAATFESSIVSLNTALKKVSADVLAEPIQNLADALNKIDPEKLETIIKTTATGAGILGGAVLAKKGYDIGKWGYSLFKGKKGTGSNPFSAVGVQDVYVTNFGDMGGGFGSDFISGSSKGKKASRASKIMRNAYKGNKTAKTLSKMGRAKSFLGKSGRFLGKGLGKGGKLLGKAATPLMIAGSVAELATAKNNKERGSAVGSLGGTLGGAKLGAVLGTMIAPGVGTAIGGLIGSGAGALAGSKLGKWVGGMFSDDKKEASPDLPQSMPSQPIHLVFDNAPKGLKVGSNPLGLQIKINTGMMEADYE